MTLPELIHAAANARARGNFALAESHYRSALVIDPTLPAALRGLIELRKQSTAELAERAMEALKAHAPQSAEASILSFAIAKCADDLEHYAVSWKWLTRANNIQRRLFTYDVKTDLRTMRQLEAAFIPAPREEADWRTDSLTPIFIVGLPRCGSTLLERIVSAHPRIRSIGESPAAPDAVRQLASWSEYLDAVSFDIDPVMLRVLYLSRMPPAGPQCGLDAWRWVDKQLLNFCYVPLLARAFQRAKFLHIRRHERAALYGIYRQRFPGTWQFAYDLKEISAFYQGYRHLMRRWRESSGAELLELEHETLVKNFEPTVRQVLDFIGVEFDPACLTPHLNPLPVQTMSSVQVREAVNTSGLEHWRHYEPWLPPAEKGDLDCGRKPELHQGIALACPKSA